MLKRPIRPLRPLLSTQMLQEIRPRLVSCLCHDTSVSWRIFQREIPRPILWCFREGSAKIAVDRLSFEARPGEIVLLHPGAHLNAEPGEEGPPKLLSINFHAWVMGTHEVISLVDIGPRPRVSDRGRMWELVEKLYALDAQKATYSLSANAALLEILALLLERPLADEASIPVNQHVLAAIKFIEGSRDRSLSVSQIADAVCISPSHLRKLFYEHFGISPMEYIHWSRFVVADRLLLERQMTVSQIAAELGFSDPNYFSRWFRKCTGASPSEYRQRSVL